MKTCSPATPVVLIAPAMAIGSGYYRPLVEAFTARGWTARTLPRRGFEPTGEQAGRRHDWSFDDEISAIRTGVAAARRDHPGHPVLLLGHSLGGQLVAAHASASAHGPGAVDGVVTVGGEIPHHVHFPRRGVGIATMAGVLVPASAATLGYVGRPLFGAPGARTLMRQWSRMVLTGQLPFDVPERVSAPALVVSLEGDELAPRPAVEDFADRLFEPGTLTRWHYHDNEVPPGATNDHIRWVRSPDHVVERVLSWWAEQQASSYIGEGRQS